MNPSTLVPDKGHIEMVHQRIRPHIHRTPVMTSRMLDEMLGTRLFFKCENFQKVGAFKSRGAVNAIMAADPEKLANGVCTHSSGNHAQALARAAALFNIKAHIVMPETAPSIKVAAVKQYGGHITFCKPTLQAREETLAGVMQSTGAMEIHPYNHPDVIMGQATCAKEVYEQVDPGIDIIMTPVGGGGLLSGTCLSTRIWSPPTMVIAAEPDGADDAYRSLKEGVLIPSVNPNTIADGLLTSLGSNTWPLVKEHVHDIITASDAYIIRAMKLIWERMKIVVEPSAVLPLAVLLRKKDEGDFGLFAGKHIAVILSGGNIDLDHLPW